MSKTIYVLVYTVYILFIKMSVETIDVITVN